MHSSIGTLILLTIAMSFIATSHSVNGQASDDIGTLLQAAANDPTNQELIDKVAAALPEVPPGSGRLIVEGDLPINREEIASYVASLATPGTGAKRSGELIVNVLPGGALDFWPEGQRKLTYVIDRKSFPKSEKADEVAKRMEDAAKEWENACPECGIDFAEVSEDEAGPGFSQAVFVVRFYNVAGGPIARAFFPSSPPSDREVAIFPDFFSPTMSFDRTGVLRHELGHTLGYRHEHIVNIPGCRTEGNMWRPLTSYTPKSVMHYFCGGAGSFELAIRDEDKRGHRCLYLTGKPCPDSK